MLPKIKRSKYILILLLVLSSYSLKAWEVRTDSTLFVNPWVGLSHYKILGFPQSFSSNYLSYGIDFDYRFHSELSFKFGVSLMSKGNYYFASYVNAENTPMGEFKTFNKFQYLSFPLLLTYNLFGGKKLNLFIDLGVNSEFLLQAKTYAKLPKTFEGVSVEQVKVVNTDTYKPLNFSLVVGCGFEYKIKPNLLVFIQAKYDHGINQILKENSTYIFKHRGYCAGIGIKIGIPIKYTTSTN